MTTAIPQAPAAGAVALAGPPSAPQLDRSFWLRLLGVAFAVRFAISFLAVAGWPLVSDGRGYSDQAERMIGALPQPVGQYYWPPGTSYVLAAFYEVLGTGRGAARLAMILVSVLSVATTVLIARRVLEDVAAVRRAGWILALLPSAVFLPSQPFSFDLTLLGLNLAVLGVLAAYDRRQARWLALGGLALGCAALARPGVLSVVAAFLVVGVLAVRRAASAGDRARVRALSLGAIAFVVLLAAPLVPAVLHNRDVGAGATISTNNEGNLLFGNNPYTNDYKTWDQGQHGLDEFPPDERRWLERNFTAGGTPEQRARMRRTAVDYMTSHMARTAWRSLNRARAFWGFDYTFSNGLRVDYGAPLPVVVLAGAAEVGGWFLLAALVLAGLLLGRRAFRADRLVFLVLVVLAYELPHLIAFSAGRWHLPVLGLLAPIAAVGVASLRSPRTALGTILRSRGLVLALVVFGLVQVEYAYRVFAAVR